MLRRVRHKLLLHLVVFASGELTNIQECCFHVDYLQGHVIFVLRVIRYRCVVRFSDGYMRGWQGLLSENIIREVIIMRSHVMWHDLNLLTQTVSGYLTHRWNNSCQDYCVIRLWLPPPASKKYVFLTEMSQFIQLYSVAFSNSIRPTIPGLPTYDWKPALKCHSSVNILAKARKVIPSYVSSRINVSKYEVDRFKTVV